MHRLRPLSAHEVCRILEKHGFTIVRQKGSHIILRKEIEGRGITVPVPNHSEIAKGTLKSIIQPERNSTVRVQSLTKCAAE